MGYSCSSVWDGSWEDTKAFTRRMRLSFHFAERGDSHSQEKYPDFIPKMDWQPPKQGRDLEAFVNRVESAVRSHIPAKPKHDNLSKSDCSALKDPKNGRTL